MGYIQFIDENVIFTWSCWDDITFVERVAMDEIS